MIKIYEIIILELKNIMLASKFLRERFMSVLYKKVFFRKFALLVHMHSSVYLVFNKRGSTGVNGAAVSTDAITSIHYQ